MYDNYEEYIAELDTEELEEIQEIVNTYFGKVNLFQLRQMIHWTHPLCAQNDLEDAMFECISRSTAHQAVHVEEDGQKENVAASRRLSNVGISNGGKRKRVDATMSPNNPSFNPSGKWTEEECVRLDEFIEANKGRKNWAECAIHVGTKNSSQCKSRYNNTRVTARNWDLYDI